MRGSALCLAASEGHLTVEWLVNLGAGMKEVLKTYSLMFVEAYGVNFAFGNHSICSSVPCVVFLARFAGKLSTSLWIDMV